MVFGINGWVESKGNRESWESEILLGVGSCLPGASSWKPGRTNNLPLVQRFRATLTSKRVPILPRLGLES